EADGTHRAELHDIPRTLDGAEAVRAFTRSVEDVGFYWELMSRDEYVALQGDAPAVEGLFVRLARERLAVWIGFAEERLAGSGVRCYMTGGNDDSPEVLTVLDEAAKENVVPCEHRVVDLDGRHTMITVGYSTPTPWGTPREASEEDLARFIETSATKVPDPGRSVFNLHVPPLDSGLDRCLKLDATSDPPSPVKDAGRPVYYGAGSRAVREAIQHYQPVVGAVRILELLAEGPEELGVTELGRRLGVHKATASRLVATLAEHGLVERNPVTDKYRLGFGVVRLAAVVTGGLDLVRQARPV